MDGVLSALLIPTERPPTSVDIKRALLVFDRVHVFDPAERNLIAPTAYMQAVGSMFGVPMPFGFGGGAVAPMGKVSGYDAFFEQTLDHCRAGLDQGLIKIESPRPNKPVFFIGNMPPPEAESWPNDVVVFNIFRRLGMDAAMLGAACTDMLRPDALSQHDLDLLAPGGRGLEIIGGQALADLEPLEGVSTQHLDALRRLALARIGSVIKAIGVSVIRELHPITTDRGVLGILERVQTLGQDAVRRALKDAGHEKAETLRRAVRVESIVFNQFLPDERLDAMSIDEVLKCRSKAWGTVGEHRTNFFDTIRKLSEEVAVDSDFDRLVKAEIAAYAKASSDLADEWTALGLKRGLPALGKGLMAQAVLASLQAMSWESAIALACALGGPVGADALKLWKKDRSKSSAAGRALLAPFRPVL